jgi:hypothetical protein
MNKLFYSKLSIDLSNSYIRVQDLSSIQPISSQSLTLNSGGFKTNGVLIDKAFSLYKYGERKNSFFKENNVDIGSLFQVTDVSYVYITSDNYNSFPWGLTNSNYINAKWIWSTQDASLNAIDAREYPYESYWFYYTFYYTGMDNTGKLYCICDNFAKIYFNYYINNSSFISSDWTTTSGQYNNITIKNGLNYIIIAAYNIGGPAGLILTIYDNANNCIVNTNEYWTFSKKQFNSYTDLSNNYFDMNGALPFFETAT